MKNKIYLSLPVLLFCGCASTFEASYDSAIGDGNPSNQGWQGNTSGSGSGHVINEQGANAWQAQGTKGKASWIVVPDAQTNNDAATYGWTMKWTARVVSGTYISNFYDNGTRRFLATLKLNSRGDLVAVLAGSKKYPLVRGQGSDQYHDYQLVYDAQRKMTTFWFDDKAINSWRGVATKSNQVSWGNSSRKIDSIANYRSFSFETGKPEAVKS